MTLPGTRCPACQRAALPGEPRCLGCAAPTTPHTFSDAGLVLAWTVTRADAAVALVELDDGARLLAHLPTHEGLAIGSSVRVVLAPSGATAMLIDA